MRVSTGDFTDEEPEAENNFMSLPWSDLAESEPGGVRLLFRMTLFTEKFTEELFRGRQPLLAFAPFRLTSLQPGAPPLHSTALHCTSLHSTPLHSTPPYSTPRFSLTSLHPGAPSLHSTPLHSTLPHLFSGRGCQSSWAESMNELEFGFNHCFLK